MVEFLPEIRARRLWEVGLRDLRKKRKKQKRAKMRGLQADWKYVQNGDGWERFTRFFASLGSINRLCGTLVGSC